MLKTDWIQKSPTELLIQSIGNMITLGIAGGFMAGMTITLVGVAIRAKDPNGYLTGGLLVASLLLFLALERMIRNKLIAELRRRCSQQ
ncbi:MAG: hypothetical protein A2091_00115 [Desulfuromonadales bacterium GWD2_61_12]|nr:MAG: hypothetical protein A2005_10975 [Desulfuromonadales bacterium GWC2_61_20]OGR36210.1 MAG: hypothetical protein A2091_00115 [Desulfuromonadales bacterium GWD2_61_12]